MSDSNNIAGANEGSAGGFPPPGGNFFMPPSS